MRRGARRLPQLSQRSNAAVGSMDDKGHILGTVTANMVGLPPDSNAPPNYWSTHSEVWELLRRTWRLEQGGPNTGGPGGGGLPGYNYVIACTFNGTFDDDQVFIRHELRVPILFPIDFANSAARLAVGSESTSSMLINVKRSTNSGTTFTSICTFTYGAGNGLPALSTGGVTVAFAVGDILLMQLSGTADATAGDIGVTLMAKMT